jgi:nucleoid-associated protein EbfC
MSLIHVAKIVIVANSSHNRPWHGIEALLYLCKKTNSMFGDMMEKLQAMQQSMGESKARLANITVEGKAEGVTVVIDGNRKVRDIRIEDAILSDKEDLQDLLVVAINKAIEAADKANEAEMAAKARDLLGK